MKRPSMEKMPEWVRFPLVLTIVAVLSAASLSALWALTTPTRLAIEARMTEEALKVVMPNATSFEERKAVIDGSAFSYRAAMQGNYVVGYVATGEASGYSSVIRVMVGMDRQFSIRAIKVLSQKETPGLGDKIEEILSRKTWGTVLTGTSPDESGLRPWFQTQFDGKASPLKLKHHGGKIESVTGATISSRAVCEAVNQAVENVKQAISQAG